MSEPLDLNFLADKINEILGFDKYVVYLNTNAFPDDIGARNVVTMNAARVPFSFTTDELNVESLNVTLTFDLPVSIGGEDFVTYNVALKDISDNLLGWKRFNVEMPTGENTTDTFNITSKFEMQPLAPPYADSGRITQQVVVTGTVLVQHAECKAILGNDVRVSIKPVDAEEEIFLMRVARTSCMQVGTDSNLLLSEEETLAQLHGISRSAIKRVTFIYTGKDIEKQFLLLAESGNGFNRFIDKTGNIKWIPDNNVSINENTVYQYTVYYGATRKVSSLVKIVSASAQDDLGVYLQYTLDLQVVPEED